jgi:ABC-2 type transport system permease protein
VALLLGYRPAAEFGGWVGAIAFAVLMILAFTWLSALGGLLLSVDAASSINFVFLFLPYLSSGFVPTDTMPVWLRGFADHQPYTPIIETMRDLLSGTAPGNTLWVALAWMVGILLVSYVGATIVFARRVKE